ncbi:MAG: FtsX-like permease family protein [Chitinophagales bacterium]|nr:FtsX-like permease family protein [Chitinophagales bacterium]
MIPILGKILKESFIIAILELYKNKLRALLSLLGITIGILCIIFVLTAVDSLKRNIEGGFETLGSDVLYIQKWPLLFTNDYPWWQFLKRPEISYKEFETIRDQLNLAESTALMAFLPGRSAKFNNKEVAGVTLTAVSHEYTQIRDMEFASGRYFSSLESERGVDVAILGANVAESLFTSFEQAIGQRIKVAGREVYIIGVNQKEGKSLIDFSLDNNILIPVRYIMEYRNIQEMGPIIAVKSMENVPVEELKYEIEGKMRSIRKLRPKEKNDFSINEVSLFTEAIDNVFRIVALAGSFIGIFAIFVGGFGIANIMFVSVKERTSIIGIKKALGAKKIYILLEFLIESIVLCFIGGLIGLLLIYLIFNVINHFLQGSDNTFVFVMSSFYINLGIILSVSIGILAGFIPAMQAANMKPVEAIRSN